MSDKAKTLLVGSLIGIGLIIVILGISFGIGMAFKGYVNYELTNVSATDLTATVNPNTDIQKNNVTRLGSISTNSGIYNYVDSETGVNYIIAKSSEGITITPRLNADGTIMVTKEN